jgi:hypothetical protein
LPTKALSFVHIKSQKVIANKFLDPTMRLTLATSALLALPTVSSSDLLLAQHKNHEEVITKRPKSAGQIRMLKNTLYSHRGSRENFSNRQAFSMPAPRLGKTNLFETTGVLKNNNKEPNRGRTLQAAGAACDPTAPRINVDTGILQCGNADLTCVEQEDINNPSNMGGICTSSTGDADDLSDGLINGVAGFIFAALCSLGADVGYSCDCQEFDLAAGAGTIKCKFAMCEDASENQKPR